MILLVSYDLDGGERPSSYERIRRYIEQHARSASRPLFSQWLVQTDATPDAWVAALRENGIVDDDDRLFVCQIRPPYQGWLATDQWAWLSAHA